MSSNAALSRHVIIRASAGSGKTFQLSNRYLQLVAAGESPQRLLATTFTRRAAAEVLERVLQRLGRAAGDNASCSRLGAELGLELSREGVLTILERLLHALHQLRICTLDSFFAQILRGHVFDFGLSPGWRVVDDASDEQLRAAAVHDVLASGKRKDLVRLVRWLAKGNVRRTVHGQLLDTVEQFHSLYVQSLPAMWRLLEPQPELPEADVAEIAREWADARLPEHKGFRRGWEKALGLLNAERWGELIASKLALQVRKRDFTYYGVEIPAEHHASWERAVRHGIARTLNEVAERTRVTLDVLERFDRAYSTRKDSHSVLRFEDVTRRLVSAGAFQALEDLYYRIDGQIGHLLLDEFQDTSADQWQVLAPIAEEIAAHVDENHSFFCVGDVKQSIYGWRGADPAIFNSIEHLLPGVVSQPLNVSYRSAPVILDVVNDVFRSLPGNPAFREKHLPAVHAWHADFEEHATARTELRGYASLTVAPAAADSDAQERATVQHSVATIVELRRRAPRRSIGVLVRENDVVARLITQLKHAGVDASEEGGVRLTDDPHVQLLLSALHLARHPGDSRSAYHVAQSPLAEALRLSAAAGNRPGRDATVRAASRLRRELSSRGLARTINRLVVALQPAAPARSRNRLRQLQDLAHRYETDWKGREEGFVAFARGTKLEDPSSSTVRVMTVHQAKGLQFDIVVLPQLEKRLSGQTPPALTARDPETHALCGVSAYFPESLASLHPALAAFHEDRHQREIRDSLSVLYVALTRAIHALYMVLPPPRTQEQRPAETFGGVLRGALAPDAELTPSSTIYEVGDPEWFAEETPPPAPTQSADDSVRAPRPALAPSRQAILRRATPSSLEGGETVRLKDRLRLESGEGMRRGSLLHAWFETIDWLERETPATEDLMRIGSELGFAEEELALLLPTFQQTLQSAPIRRLFERAEVLESFALTATDLELECQRERRFAVRDGDRLLSGSFDRVVLARTARRVEKVLVVDFKTDTVRDEDALTRLTEHYRPQLLAYGRAASRVFRVDTDDVLLQIAFVSAPRVVELQERAQGFGG